MFSLLLLVACHGDKESTVPEGPPFGMILKQDNQLYAGISRVILTPPIDEVFEDLNGNHTFDGCVNEPLGLASGRTICTEPFNDANGNGYFDAIWIAGYGSRRAAMGVHDDITLTALVLSLNEEYVAILGIDEVGLLENRTRDGRLLLDADGFDKDRVVISSSHSHQSPDTVGIWGDLDNLSSGINPSYSDTIAPAMHDAVADAAAHMVAVSPKYGQLNVGEWDPELSGSLFGGTNPDDRQVGTINDIRDPIIAGDNVLALALDQADGSRFATMVNFSAHPEVVGDENNELSADYVYYLRSFLEDNVGGLSLFVSGSLGGMQSGLGATLPQMSDDGQKLKDDQGNTLWVQGSGWEMAHSQGILVAQAAEAALTDTTPWEKIAVRSADLPIPVTNEYYQLAFRLNILDTRQEDLLQNDQCPGYGVDPNVFGCVPAGIWVLELGPITLGTVPGELFPELFWGVPDEPAMSDAALRLTDRRWEQEPPECVGVPYSECKDKGSVGDCNCLYYHNVPYILSDDATMKPIREMLPGTYRAPMGITNGYCGYIVPGPDFNTYASELTDDGDHYEETNSCSSTFGVIVQETYRSLLGQ